MSTEENKRLVQHYVEQVVNRGNMAVADELFSPDYKRYIAANTLTLTADA